METIEFNGKTYPKFQSEGNAARWIMPYAKHFCKGEGVDIGAHTKAWAFPGAKVVDPIFDGQSATEFAADNLDYIFSSHCLEHVKENWYNVLDYWLTKLKEGGIILLYLPHKSQEYWLPKNNRKHVHSFDGSEIKEYLESLGHQVFLSGVDLNNAFVLVCEKKWDEPIPHVQSKTPGDTYLIKGEDLGMVVNRTKNSPIIDHGQVIKADYFKNANCIWYNGERYTTK